MQRLALVLVLAGCSSSTDSTAPAMIGLTGTYTGLYTTNTAPGQGFDARLIMIETTPAAVEGTIALPSATLPLPFTGAYMSGIVTIVVTAPPPYLARGTARFAVSDSGKHLEGELIGTDGSFVGDTFSMTLTRF